jgi:hypothetical protein
MSAGATVFRRSSKSPVDTDLGVVPCIPVSFPGPDSVDVGATVVEGPPESSVASRLHALSSDAATIRSREIRTERDIDTSADRREGSEPTPD